MLNPFSYLKQDNDLKYIKSGSKEIIEFYGDENEQLKKEILEIYDDATHQNPYLRPSIIDLILRMEDLTKYPFNQNYDLVHHKLMTLRIRLLMIIVNHRKLMNNYLKFK